MTEKELIQEINQQVDNFISGLDSQIENYIEKNHIDLYNKCLDSDLEIDEIISDRINDEWDFYFDH